MDLHTIRSVARPASRAALPPFEPGDAFLGGGTWLLSEPQPHLRRLIDLPSLGWPALSIGPEGLTIAATCTLAELAGATWPASWLGASLIGACCRALLGSFKIWNAATVGGNLCLALPAGPMTALAAALEGTCVVWDAAGGERAVAAADFVTGVQRTALREGEILRRIELPEAALRRPAAFRQVSLTALGRSAALLIGTRAGGAFHLTVTASTPHPVRLGFPALPDRATLAAAIDAAVPAWLDDVHGAPDWRRHVTHLAAREIRAELARPCA